MAQRTRWAAFGCVHLNRGKVYDRAMRLIREYKPDVLVCLGDILDSDGASRFPVEDPKPLSVEYAIGNKMLEQAADAAGSAKLVFLEGNHEFNVRDKMRIKKEHRDLCDYRLHMTALKDWEWKPYDCSEAGLYRLGQVTFAHGYRTGPRCNEKQAVEFCRPFGLGVFAHDHKPMEPRQVEVWAGIHAPFWAMNVGTLGSLRPGYMKRKSTFGWGHGVALGSCTMIRSARASKLWNAELVRIEP